MIPKLEGHYSQCRCNQSVANKVWAKRERICFDGDLPHPTRVKATEEVDDEHMAQKGRSWCTLLLFLNKRNDLEDIRKYVSNDLLGGVLGSGYSAIPQTPQGQGLSSRRQQLGLPAKGLEQTWSL
jgi:hypothetical protein